MKNLFLGSLLVLLIPLSAVAVEKRDQEIKELLAVYQSGDLVAQKKQTEYLQWAGLVDESLYDQIGSNLLSIYQDIGDDRLKADAASWLAKGLAYSGNPKYLPILEQVKEGTDSRKLQKYVDEALVYLPRYRQWNSIINNSAHWDEDKSGVINRYMNMIRSDELHLNELAIKRIYNERVFDQTLLALIHRKLLAHYQDNDGSREFGTTYATMAKALAAVDKDKYRDTILTVSKGATNRRLRKLATRYIREFDIMN